MCSLSWSIFQSRQQWCEEGDKISWYFFNLEKRNSKQKSINRLELSDTNITEDPGAIWNEMKMYYQKLRRKTPINDSKRYLSDVKDINKVTDEDYTIDKDKDKRSSGSTGRGRPLLTRSCNWEKCLLNAFSLYPVLVWCFLTSILNKNVWSFRLA